MAIADLVPSSVAETRSLILSGLAEHWGEVDESLNPDLDDMLESYKSGRTIVAVDGDGVVVGTGTVIPLEGEGAEVRRMSVAKQVQHHGIGRRILDELVETARRWGCRSVVLETSSNWDGVVDFYRRCGFRITHTEDGPFGSDTWFSLDL